MGGATGWRGRWGQGNKGSGEDGGVRGAELWGRMERREEGLKLKGEGGGKKLISESMKRRK